MEKKYNNSIESSTGSSLRKPVQMRQIERKHYDAKLKKDGMRTIIKYGIACYQKDCHVILGD